MRIFKTFMGEEQSLKTFLIKNDSYLNMLVKRVTASVP